MKDNESKTSLHRGLKSRHMQMIALGASVGTGLFYGSAPTIQLVGPGVIFSYLLTGIFIFFLMRMLGEMSVREPVSGSLLILQVNIGLPLLAIYLVGITGLCTCLPVWRNLLLFQYT